jgi:hypothetical protein
MEFKDDDECVEEMAEIARQRRDDICDAPTIAAQQQQQINELKAMVERLRDVLMQRDGGVHDVDCKINRGRECNCMHNEAVLLLHQAPPQALTAHDNAIRVETIEEVASHFKSNYVQTTIRNMTRKYKEE